MTDNKDRPPPSERLADALQHMGATITSTNDDGSIDFETAGFSGMARIRSGRFRSSFFISFDPDEGEVDEFLSRFGSPPVGELQLLEIEDGTVLRLLVELKLDDGEGIWQAGQVARAVFAAWRSARNGNSDLLSTLARAGIALPPLGTGLAMTSTIANVGAGGEPVSLVPGKDVFAFGPWHWGTRYVNPMSLYMFYPEQIAQLLIENGPFFAMSHAGHGLNSYGLNLVTCAGPVAVYVQHGWGGVYMNPVGSLVDINATYSRLHVLFGADEISESNEQLRWLLVYSTFRGTCGLIDLDKVRAGSDVEHAFESFGSEDNFGSDERALFSGLVDRLELKPHDFAMGGNLEW